MREGGRGLTQPTLRKYAHLAVREHGPLIDCSSLGDDEALTLSIDGIEPGSI